MSAPAACPADVLDLLPWYPEGALGDAERGRVESHAAQCAACRHELALIDGSAEPGSEGLPDRELLWARTLARISAGESSGAAPAVRLPRARTQVVPWAAAAAVLLALAAGVWAGTRLGAGGDPDSYTPAGVTPQPVGPGAELDVVFRPDASIDAIGSALRELDAAIVAGPSEVSGIYRVRLAAGSDAAEAARGLRAGVASFAEPLPQ
jgi:anti-sigma factor RsiW